MKKAKIASVSASASLLMTSLSGCSFGTSIDNLMAPPKLSVEQEQIYNALTDAAGSSISLKYPKSGMYLSAFIVEDIDGDGGSEAVVFYEKTGLTVEENTLRINILDQSGGSWRSVCDTPADGAEIEKVMISRLGSNDRVNLIIGSSLINRSEKTVTIYNYSDGDIEKTFSSSYSFIDVTDLDKDEQNEFLLLSGSASDAPAVAESYKLDEDGMYHKYSLELSGSFTAFDSIVYGDIGADRTGLYIDAVNGTGLIQTDVIYMDSGGLHKIFEKPEDSLSTVRAYGCNSYDIDGDGMLEIPVQVISPGYEELPESEQMKLTNMLALGASDKLQRKYSSYFSVSDGYVFIFPDKWHDHVTVKRDIINDEIVICVYENGIEGRELLRICCAEDTVTREDRLSNGYMLLSTRGEISYLASIPAESEANAPEDGLSITAADAAVCFRVIK